MSLGKTIKMCRKEKGLTQSELAFQIGVSMQAVSKWETDTGMPDISQIVPLARVLDVSADKLLGLESHDGEEELNEIKKQINFNKNLICGEDAESVYNLVYPFFREYPANAQAAMLCLESLTGLLHINAASKDKEQIRAEGERYANCIFKYENDSDAVCKAYYVMARFYSLIGEKDKSASMHERIPFFFGDRYYLEAENAWAEKNNSLAVEKCKKSFAFKTHFISRCIRMIAKIHEHSGLEGGAEKSLEYYEYMLRIINALLSGGDYIPSRQMFQKTELLHGMVYIYLRANNPQKAFECLKLLVSTKKEYSEFLESPENKHHLMFAEETPGEFHREVEALLTEYIREITKLFKEIPEINRNPEFSALLKQI